MLTITHKCVHAHVEFRSICYVRVYEWILHPKIIYKTDTAGRVIARTHTHRIGVLLCSLGPVTSHKRDNSGRAQYTFNYTLHNQFNYTSLDDSVETIIKWFLCTGESHLLAFSHLINAFVPQINVIWK